MRDRSDKSVYGPESDEYKDAERKILRVIQLVYEARSIQKALKEVGMDPGTFDKWVCVNPAWLKRYQMARQFKAQSLADAIIDISDEYGDPQRARNQIDARKWLASKLKPAEYGDRIEVNVTQHLSIGDALREARNRALPVRDLEVEARPQTIDAIDVQAIESTGSQSVQSDDASQLEAVSIDQNSKETP